ncbi:nickel-responsive transcriptional regulator NikR [Halorubrum luteum]
MATDRVSLTLPSELVEELDDIVDEWGYSSRSSAAREALRGFLAERHWEDSDDRRQRGSITIVYDHHVRGLTDDLLDVQHAHEDVVVATQHVHFDPDLCLETLVVNGPTAEIRALLEGINGIDGVEQVRFTVV